MNKKITGILVTIGKRTKTEEKWAEKVGISVIAFRARVKNKPEQEWLLPPDRRTKKILLEAYDKKQTAEQWSDETGTPVPTIWYRLNKGKTVEEAIDSSKAKKRKKTESVLSDKKYYVIPDDIVQSDLEMARRIIHYKSLNMSDEEILIKEKLAA